jgi:peptidyl-prolyl cis-trans isomerase C
MTFAINLVGPDGPRAVSLMRSLRASRRGKKEAEMSKSSWISVVVVAYCVLALSGCDQLRKEKVASPASGGVAATVNGVPVSSGLLDLVIKQRASRTAVPEPRDAVLDQLVKQFILAQEAEKLGLDKTPDVSNQIELTQKAILANAFVQNYTRTHPVSDDELKAAYEKFKAQAAGKEYKARHILVQDEADARAIVAKLKRNPQIFEALAKEKSKDTGSRDNGGELGWFDPRTMVPEFGEAVSKLAKGQFTDQPVKSKFGYHVILLEDVRDKQVPSIEQLKPALERQVTQANLSKLVDDLRAKAKVEVTPVAAPSAPSSSSGSGQ